MSAKSNAAQPQAHFRTVLGHFATGVAIVSARNAGNPVGMTVQSFCSLSLDPPLILLCPVLSSTSWPKIEKAGRLCVNLLAEGQADLARQFAQSGSDKYRGVAWVAAPHTGSPVLQEALGWIDCEIQEIHPGGDHVVVICQVRDVAEALKRAESAGGIRVEDPTQGEHEVRGAFRDPDGHLFYVYSPLGG